MLLNNRYQIIRTLGSGGFGNTFLAEDTQMPSGRKCVIKQLKPIENNPQIYKLVQERFRREAAILEELGELSNQIPTLYAYFYLSDKFYLVQELIEGDTLTAKVQQQGLFNQTKAKEILSNILPVLEFVHSKRIVHRDIKPDNIILRHSDGKPVLIDFGAVRETMATVINSHDSVTASIVVGTPGYMPSEQAVGRAIYSSDLYSLGLTIIYLLTGKLPQQLEMDSRTGEIVWQSEAGNISPSFKTIIDKAIAYHPRERFCSAIEMLEALLSSATPLPDTVPFQQRAVSSHPSKVVSETQTQQISQKQISQQQVTKYQETTPNQKRGILPQSIIIGSIISIFTMGGLWLLRPLITDPFPIQTTTNDFSWLSSRKVTDKDLENLDGYTLDIMRNSIFARHGRRFLNPGLQEYFDQQSWYIPKYSPQEFPSNLLSDLERRNVKYISEYQDRTNKRFFEK